ncbi:hypothetical protein [Spirosoma jeollabukense]
MRLIKVTIPFLLLLVMPVFPSNGITRTPHRAFLSDQVWAINERLTKLETVRLTTYKGEKSNLEWDEWLFIVERQ